MSLIGLSVVMADDVSKFMDRYEQVVEDIEAIDSKDYEPATLDSIRSRYDKLTDEVDKVKPEMKDNDRERYYKLKARYQKKLAVLKAKRGAKSVIGWVKGVIGK